MIEELSERGIAGQIEGETAQRLLHRVLTVVADACHGAAARVLEHETFEQVVYVRRGKGQIHLNVAIDLSLALEVSDAAAE